MVIWLLVFEIYTVAPYILGFCTVKAPALASTSSTEFLIKLQDQIEISLFQYNEVHNLWNLTKLS